MKEKASPLGTPRLPGDEVASQESQDHIRFVERVVIHFPARMVREQDKAVLRALLDASEDFGASRSSHGGLLSGPPLDSSAPMDLCQKAYDLGESYLDARGMAKNGIGRAASVTGRATGFEPGDVYLGKVANC